AANRSGVLIVGRIETRKNQLLVLQALRDTDVPVTLVGAPNPLHNDYVRQVAAEVSRNPRSRWIGERSHSDLAALYLTHSVHINASWYEVAPLVDLEAAVLGCAVISTTAGYTAEYLGDTAQYVDPGLSTSDLRTIILSVIRDAR